MTKVSYLHQTTHTLKDKLYSTPLFKAMTIGKVSREAYACWLRNLLVLHVALHENLHALPKIQVKSEDGEVVERRLPGYVWRCNELVSDDYDYTCGDISEEFVPPLVLSDLPDKVRSNKHYTVGAAYALFTAHLYCPGGMLVNLPYHKTHLLVSSAKRDKAHASYRAAIEYYNTALKYNPDIQSPVYATVAYDVMNELIKIAEAIGNTYNLNTSTLEG